MLVQTTLRQLMKEAHQEFAVANVGGDQPTQRDLPREISRLLVPGDQIRKGAPKMQLRDWEEASLELVSTRAHACKHMPGAFRKMHAVFLTLPTSLRITFICFSLEILKAFPCERSVTAAHLACEARQCYSMVLAYCRTRSRVCFNQAVAFCCCQGGQLLCLPS